MIVLLINEIDPLMGVLGWLYNFQRVLVYRRQDWRHRRCRPVPSPYPRSNGPVSTWSEFNTHGRKSFYLGHPSIWNKGQGFGSKTRPCRRTVRRRIPSSGYETQVGDFDGSSKDPGQWVERRVMGRGLGPEHQIGFPRRVKRWTWKV